MILPLITPAHREGERIGKGPNERDEEEEEEDDDDDDDDELFK